MKTESEHILQPKFASERQIRQGRQVVTHEGALEVLSAAEAAKVRQGEADLAAGRSKSWQSVEHEWGG